MVILFLVIEVRTDHNMRTASVLLILTEDLNNPPNHLWTCSHVLVLENSLILLDHIVIVKSPKWKSQVPLARILSSQQMQSVVLVWFSPSWFTLNLGQDWTSTNPSTFSLKMCLFISVAVTVIRTGFWAAQGLSLAGLSIIFWFWLWKFTLTEQILATGLSHA